MSIMLTLKLSLVPSFIGGITLAGRKWGPGIAGWLSAFPVVTGPILLFISIEQGASFAQAAASSTLLAILAALVFGLSYSWAATKYSWATSLAGSFLCYFVAVLVLNAFSPSLTLAILIVLASIIIAPRFYPSIALPTASLLAPHNDMLIRMGAGAAFVLLITHFSSNLGAHLSGLLAMFPVMASVLAVFTHRQSGNIFAIHLLRGMVFGYYAFTCFCLVLALMLPSFSIASAFLTAFSTAAVIQAISRRLLKRL